MVASSEAFAHVEYKRRLLGANGRATDVTTAFGPEYPSVPYCLLRTDLVREVAGREDQIQPPQPGDAPIGETVLFPFTCARTKYAHIMVPTVPMPAETAPRK